MFARLVRFTGVDDDLIAKIQNDIESSDGPPPGVEAKNIKLMYDADHSTSVVLVLFDTEDQMRAADKVFNEMDPGDVAGSRASVDLCEVKIDRDA